MTGVKVSRVIKILHLIFVDDILIMTKDSLEEWIVIKFPLDLLWCASRLKVNLNKSTFHHFGVHHDFLTHLPSLFHYGVKCLSEGFKYLGFQLKIDSYKVANWKWLLKKYEQRIYHWCNCFLTLGGRYVLLKAMLESQPVY